MLHFVKQYDLICTAFIGFGGVVLACWPLVPKFAGSNSAEVIGFLRRKNPQRAFHGRGCKAFGPISVNFGM
jgi:hypothetical protein